MKKTQITFDITSEKTLVTAVGLNGFTYKIDITGTDIEKDFTDLLKKLSEYERMKKILDAIDLNTWQS